MSLLQTGRKAIFAGELGESWQKEVEYLVFAHENGENAIKMGKNCLSCLTDDIAG